MAVSLSFTAGGIILLYSFMGCASHVRSDTQCRGISFYSGEQRGRVIVLILTLAWKAGLLFVAAIQDFLPATVLAIRIVGCPIGFDIFPIGFVTQKRVIMFCVAALLDIAVEPRRVDG